MNLAIDICFDVRDGPHLVDHFQATRTTIIIIILLFLSYTSYTSANVTDSGDDYDYDYDDWYVDYQNSWSATVTDGNRPEVKGKVNHIPKTKEIIGPAPNLIC